MSVMTPRYTLNGSTAIENKIHQQMKLVADTVADAMGNNLISLLLIGSYGRGEGAVDISAGQETIFNDLDFFAVVQSWTMWDKKQTLPRLKSAEKALSQTIGFPVDVGVISLKKWQQAPYSLMNYEMRQQSVVIYGDPDILNQMPDYKAPIPIEEGLRLLLNRGMLLLICKKLLYTSAPVSIQDREMIIKYLQKAARAMGDSYLILTDQYHFSYQIKRATISRLTTSDFSRFDALKNRYLTSVDFKFQINYADYQETDIHAWYNEIISLYADYWAFYETKRLNQKITWADYPKLILHQAQQRSLLTRLKNQLISQRLFGMCDLFSNTAIWGTYPRDRLIMVLPQVLYEDHWQSPEFQRWLHAAHVTRLSQFIDHYFQLWLRYS